MVSQLRGDYIQAPPTVEKSTFPRYSSTTSSTSTTGTSGDTSGTTEQNQGSTTTGSTGAAASTSTTDSSSTTTTTGSSSSESTTAGTSTTDSVLPMADSKTTGQKGKGGVGQIGMEYKGLGAYQSSEEISSNDLQYLSGLLQTYLFLMGVYVVPPSEAEIDVYVTVDVFGTVRSRVEWFIANNEILRAKTSLEVLAVDHLSGRVVIAPQSTGAEAEYNEQYILWAGPIMIKETLTKSEPLLSDFALEEDEKSAEPLVKDVSIPYPFQIQMERTVVR
ncbi:MAG: Adhesin MafA2 [uncultured bacterium]|nr:MAG: Adhesin MafA2 [uncultured bacterium]